MLSKGSQILEVLQPAILVNRVCGVCPKFLLGQQLHASKWRNFTFANWLILTFLFIYANILLYRLCAVVIGSPDVKFVIILNYLLVTPTTYKLTIFFLCLFSNQKEWAGIFQDLENFLKGKSEINRKKSKRILYGWIAVTLFILLQLIFVESYRLLKMNDEEMIKDSLNMGVGILSENSFFQRCYAVFTVLIFTFYYLCMPFSFQIIFVTLCIIFSECVKINFAKHENGDISSYELFDLFQQHRKLYLIFQRFNKFYSRIMLGLYTSMTAAIVTVFPVVIDYYKSNSAIHFVYFYSLIFLVMIVVCLTFAASDIQQTFEESQIDVLEKLQEVKFIDMSLYLEKISILKQIGDMKMEIKLWGFCKLDRKLLLTLLVNTITFVVIVVQFSPGN